MDEITSRKLLKSSIFAFSFVLGEKHGSDLTFGYYDKHKYKGEISWNKIIHKYFYGVKLDDVKIGGKSTGICKKIEECIIAFDSG